MQKTRTGQGAGAQRKITATLSAPRGDRPLSMMLVLSIGAKRALMTSFTSGPRADNQVGSPTGAKPKQSRDQKPKREKGREDLFRSDLDHFLAEDAKTIWRRKCDAAGWTPR